MVNKINRSSKQYSRFMQTLSGLLFVSALFFQLHAQSDSVLKARLSIPFKGDAKIEVGSAFVGLSFHHSTPLPQRVSFYYPVANSIDHSVDYWRRDTTFVISAGVQFGSSKVDWLQSRGMAYTHTPFSVDFSEQQNDKAISVSYRFTKSKPAVVITYTVTNKTKEPQTIKLFTRYVTDFHTSHSYQYRAPSGENFSVGGRVALMQFPYPETGRTALLLLTPGKQPERYQYVSAKNARDTLRRNSPDAKLVSPPVVNYVFSELIQPGKSLVVEQEMVSVKQSEAENVTDYLLKHTDEEITTFEHEKLSSVFNGKVFETGDAYLDKSVIWSKAMLETTKHFIAGDTMPMPCPAEYNFFFTHDVLLTDLAAIYYDPARVKHDLRFIMAKSDSAHIIPHAYYWRDTGFVTEFADHDNWNNFWFLITTTSYLRHTMDTAFVRELYPYMSKSLAQAMLTKGNDSLMWSYRPDWWDIGKRYGRRSYMTTLSVRALRDYVYTGTLLGENPERLCTLEQGADEMQAALVRKLWCDSCGFLMNDLDSTTIDQHYYSGSLLAVHYGLLDPQKIAKTIATTETKLLEPKTGITVVTPMDFDTLSKVWNFVGDEVGKKYYYINGGIWPHANAWYALALIAGEKRESAYHFIHNIMTINGIMDGPNGQPAMYEVRNANVGNPKEFGTVDKPQFMWAGGWYLYSLYHLFAVGDETWNISLNPWLMAGQQEVNYALTVEGKAVPVQITREGAKRNAAATNFDVSADGQALPSLILPNEKFSPRQLTLREGSDVTAYLKSTGSVLETISSDKESMHLKLHAFAGHKNTTVIVAKQTPKKILVDGEPVSFAWNKSGEFGEIKFSFVHKSADTEISVSW